MNLLRLLKILLSPKLIREIFLFVQITIMVIFFNLVLIPYEAEIQLSKGIESTFKIDNKNLIHFNPDASYFNADELWIHNFTQNLYKNEKINDIFQIHKTYTEFNLNKNIIRSNFLVYSTSLFNISDIDLSIGVFTNDLGTEKNVLPVIISNSLANEMPVGSKFNATMPNSKEEITCKVTGIMKPNATFLAINEYGSFPSLYIFGGQTNSINSDFIITAYQPFLSNVIKWDSPTIIASDDADNLNDELNEMYNDYGRFATYTDIKNISMEQVRQNNQYSSLLLILFIPIVIFGYGGYVYITLTKRKKEFGIFYILGLSRRKMITLNFIIGVIVLTLAVCTGTIFSPLILNNLFKTLFNGYTTINYVLIILLFTTIYLISIIIGFVQTIHVSSITLYREVD